MKVLSIKQPFAELIVSGKKTIELRKWNTKFRGEFLIHASQIPDKKAMKNYQFDKLPLGFIVGKARLINVKKYQNKEEHKKDKHKHLASWSWGAFGFILKNQERTKLIRVKGKLNFWDFEKELEKTN